MEPTPENLARVVRALQDLGFPLSESEADRLRSGCALARLRHRAMDLGVICRPDGIPSFREARTRGRAIDGARRLRHRGRDPEQESGRAAEGPGESGAAGNVPAVPDEETRKRPPLHAGDTETTKPHEPEKQERQRGPLVPRQAQQRAETRANSGDERPHNAL